MYAIIKTGGKQYQVKEGDIIKVEKLNVEEGSTVEFETLLVSNDSDVNVGSPLLDTTVKAEVLEHGKGKKIVVFKYKSKKHSSTKQGHRQPYTRVRINSLG